MHKASVYAFLAIAAFILAGNLFATVSFVDQSNNTYWLHWDSGTESYKDSSLTNQDNLWLKVCQPGYNSSRVGLFFIENNTTSYVHNYGPGLAYFVPDPVNCSLYDIDVQDIKSRLPGLVTVVFSNYTSLDVTRDQQEKMDAPGGWLVGSYRANMSQSGSVVTVNITDAYTGLLCTSPGLRLTNYSWQLTDNVSRMSNVVGVYDSNDNLIGSDFVHVGIPQNISVSGTAAWVRINGITPSTCDYDPNCIAPNMMCPDGTCAWTCVESGGGGSKPPRMNLSAILNSTGGTYFNARMNLTGWANATSANSSDMVTYYLKWYQDGTLRYADHVSNASTFALGNSTLGLWHMGETNGTLVADATGRFNATATSGAGVSAARFGNARYFPQESYSSNSQAAAQIYANVTSAQMSGLNALSVEMWLRPNLSANYSGNKTNMDYIVLGGNLSQLKIGYSFSSGRLYATAIDKAGAWNSSTISGGGIVRSLAESPSGKLLAGTDIGLYSSSDDGATWSYAGLSTLVNSILVMPDGSVYAAGDDGAGTAKVYYSASNLSNWTDTGSLSGATTATQLARAPDGSIYVATDTENILKYSGGSWQLSCGSVVGATAVNSLMITSQGTFLAGSASGEIYKSADCSSWSSAYSGSVSVNAFLAADDGSIYAAASQTSTSGRVLKSTDNGTTWANTGTLTSASDVQSLLEGSDGTIYAGARIGTSSSSYRSRVYKSADKGASWSLMNANIGPSTSSKYVQSLLEASTGMIYAGTGESGITYYLGTIAPFSGNLYTGPLDSSQWEYIAYSANSTTTSIYLNEFQAANFSFGMPAMTFDTALIGRGKANYEPDNGFATGSRNSGFVGLIDEVRILNASIGQQAARSTYGWYSPSALVNVQNFSGLVSYQNWTLEVTPSNGIRGQALNSSPVYISYANIPPVMANSTILNATNGTYADSSGTLVGFANATDADNNTLSYYYKWYKNGALFSSGVAAGNYTQGRLVNISSIPNSSLSADSVWVLEITPFDGLDNGTALNSSPFAISHMPPSIPSLRVLNSTGGTTFRNGSVLVGYANASQADNDTLNYTYKWYRNGVLNSTGSFGPVLQGIEANIGNSTPAVGGDRWKFEVTASNGYSNATSSVFVAVGSEPQLSLVQIRNSTGGSALYTNSSLLGYANGTDFDGNNLGYYYKWYLDGTLNSSGSIGVVSAPSNATLRPAGIGNSSQLSAEPAPPNWQSVDEASMDGLTSYVFADSGSYLLDLYTVTSGIVPSGSPITSLELFAVAESFGAGTGGTVELAIREHNVTTLGAAHSVTSSWATYSDSWQYRPSDFGNWNSADMSSLQIGVKAKGPATSGSTFVTQVYAIVNYSTPNGFASSALVNIANITGTGVVKHQNWTLEATPTNGPVNGSAVNSTTITVLDTAPVTSVPAIAPPTIYQNTSQVSCVNGTSSDFDGDNVSFYYKWFVNGNFSGITSQNLTNSSFSNGATIICQITPFDGELNGTSMNSSQVQVINSPPVTGTPVLSPTPAYKTTPSITCSANSTYDPDGDNVTLSYKWFVNGNSAGVSSQSITNSSYSKGDSIVCQVTPSDPFVNGTSVNSSPLAILNSVPQMALQNSIANQSAGHRFRVSAGVFDGDGASDMASTNISSTSGSCVYVSNSTAGGYFNVTYECSGTALASTTVSIGFTDKSGAYNASTPSVAAYPNHLPVATNVTLAPAVAYASTLQVNCTASPSDADNDTVTLNYLWFKNGASTGIATSSISNASYARGDSLVCQATPYDGYQNGTAVNSTALVVSNSLPVTSAPYLVPSVANKNTPAITCYNNTTADADGDSVTFSYLWFVNNASTGITGQSVTNATYYNAVDLRCQITPNDGIGNGAAVNSTILALTNTPPVTAAPALSPIPAYKSSGQINCTNGTTSDNENDTVAFFYRWYVNGVAQAASTPYLASSNFNKSSLVVCQVTPFDGIANGTAVNSSALVVSNSNPVLAVENVFANQSAGHKFRATAGVYDADGGSDIASTNISSSSGSCVYVSNSTSGPYFNATYECTGAAFASSTVSIGFTDKSGAYNASAPAANSYPNHLPAISNISLSPSTAYVTTAQVNCSATGADIDNDTVSVSYSWFKNGASAGVSTSSITNASYARGDSLVCQATPYDGYQNGTASNSSALVISNSLPVTGVPTLAPPTAAKTTLNITCNNGTTSDADGDSVSFTYRWFVNSAYSGITTQYITNSSYTNGQSVVCEIRPFDGTASGTARNSSALLINNTAPTTAAPILAPIPAYKSTAQISCTPNNTFDAEGDTVSYYYKWYVNGVAVAPSAASINNSYFYKNDIVICQVTPTDGLLNGTAANSSGLAISNSNPALAVESVFANQSAGHKFRATAGVYDADGGSDIASTNISSSSGSCVYVSNYTSGSYFNVTYECTGTAFASSTVSIGFTDKSGAYNASAPAANSYPNHAPATSAPSLAPSTAYKQTPQINCTNGSTSDPDNDTVSFYYSWSVNGASAGIATSYLTNSSYSIGDIVSCSITPTDGYANGTSQSSANLTIVSSVPFPPANVTISPSPGYGNSSFTFAGYGASTPDGTNYTYYYRVRNSTATLRAYSSNATFDCSIAAGCSGRLYVDAIIINQYGINSTSATNSTQILNSPPYIAVQNTFADSASNHSFTVTGGVYDADGSEDITNIQISASSGTCTVQSISQGIKTLNATYYCTGASGVSTTISITFRDSASQQASTTPSVHAFPNGAPVTSAPSIVPVPVMKANPSLTCQNASVSDPENDSTSMHYAWYVNGALVSASQVIPSSYFNKSDTVFCQAIPTDGYLNGTAQNSTSYVVQNSPPSTFGAGLSPVPMYPNSTVTCANTSAITDADGDAVSLTYRFFNSTTELQAFSPAGTLSCSPATCPAGMTLSCTIRASDGTDHTDATVSRVISSPANTPPAALSSRIVNSTGGSGFRRGYILVGMANATDNQSDPVYYNYKWYLNGTLNSSGSSAYFAQGIESNAANRTGGIVKGQRWVLEIRPSDGMADGQAINSTEITIGNTPPTDFAVGISAPAYPGTLVNCTNLTPYSDVDGDSLAVRYQFSTGSGVVQAFSSSSQFACSASTCPAGTNLTCTASAFDGTDYTNASASTTIQSIPNAPPQAGSVSLLNSTNGTYVARQNAIYGWATSTDPNGDSISYYYSWYLNGARNRTGFASGFQSGVSGLVSSIPASEVVKGQIWTLEVVPTDGTLNGTAANSSALTVQNTAPQAPYLIAPSSGQVLTNGNVSFDWSDSADPDGDNVSYYLYMGTSPGPAFYGISTSSATNLSLSPGTYYWRVAGFDGTGFSANSSEWNFTIDLSAPSVQFVAPTPAQNYIGSTGRLDINASISAVANISSCTVTINGISFNGTLSSQAPPAYCSYSLPTAQAGSYNYSVLVATTDSRLGYSGTRTYMENSPPSLVSVSSANATVAFEQPWQVYANATDLQSSLQALNYSFYLGTSLSSLALAQSGTSPSAYFSLADNTTYYWQAVISDGLNSTSSPVFALRADFSELAASIASPAQSQVIADTLDFAMVYRILNPQNSISCSYELADSNGTVINSSAIACNATSLSVAAPAYGTYTVRLYETDYLGYSHTANATFSLSQSPPPVSSGGGAVERKLQVDLAATCAGETATITVRDYATRQLLDSSVEVTPSSLGLSPVSVSTSSAGKYVFVPEAGSYQLSVSKVGYSSTSKYFTVQSCAVPPSCRNLTVSCQNDYDCCSGICTDGICSLERNQTPVVLPPINLTVNAQCTQFYGSASVSPPDATLSLYRIVKNVRVPESLFHNGTGAYIFQPSQNGTFVVTAVRNGYLYSEKQFEVVDCAKPPACLPDGQVCSLGTSCCSGYCSEAAVCEARLPVSQCKLPSASCQSTKECCSGECVANRCAECSPLLQKCQISSDCCTGFCNMEGRCVLGEVVPAPGIQLPQIPVESIALPLAWLVLAASAYMVYRVSIGMAFFPIELGLLPVVAGMFVHPVIGIAVAAIELVIVTKSGLPATVKEFLARRRRGKGDGQVPPQDIPIGDYGLREQKEGPQKPAPPAPKED
ncbi:MAG: hypothetical protein WC506_06485 [Candidatus Micrarchaeia archaeon]